MRKGFVIVGAIAAILMVIGVVINLNSSMQSNREYGYADDFRSVEALNAEESQEWINNWYDEIRPTYPEPVIGDVNLEELRLEALLPPLRASYEPVVSMRSGTGATVTLVSSTEKATDNISDRWLIDAVNEFNRQSQSGAIELFGIASGEAADYILAGEAIDAFSPSNSLWADMLNSNGVKLTEYSNRLVGNVAGVVVKKNKASELRDKYGDISINTILSAINNDGLSFGYTNPNASSTGMNFLIEALNIMDKDNIISDGARAELQNLSKKVSLISYSTLQMRAAAASGRLEAFVYESQQLYNTAGLEDYEFIPFGVRHDSPLYSIGNIGDEKSRILTEFVDFVQSEDQQNKARELGFNLYSDYAGIQLDGSYAKQAQAMWKNEKSGGKEVGTIFVVDRSGSMEGERIQSLVYAVNESQKGINDNVNVGLVSFATNVTVDVPIGKMDIRHRSEFVGAINNMRVSGGTAMYNGIVVAEKLLNDWGRDNPNSIKQIIVLTDGDVTEGLSLERTEGALKGNMIPIYAVGFGYDSDELQDVANLNEASYIKANEDNVAYRLASLFNAQM